MRAGDVIFGDDADGVFRPIVRLRPEQARLVARVELRAEGLLAFDGATATVAVSRIGDGSPRETVAVQLAEVGDPGRCPRRRVGRADRSRHRVAGLRC